ncbi:MAG: MarR family transcriptional regulator [Nonomuraea sp.]|nr:MarR family transcriptional regulator [Nonomuraea sp.]
MGPDESPGFLLWRLTLRWQRAITATLAPLGLTHVQFVLLASTWWLNDHGERPNQLSVARHAETDVKMTSQVLRKLEEKGLLSREVDPADTRARLLLLTPRGRELAVRAVAAVERADADFFATLDDNGTLATALRTITHPTAP